MQDDRKQKLVQSLDRAVAILDSFTADRQDLGVSDIARLTRLSRSTTHRLLMSLQHNQLVRQVPGGTRYALGPHVLRLAHAALAHVALETIAEPIMTWLRDTCGETVGFHLPHGEYARTVVSQVESRQPLRRTYTDIGQPIPIYQGAPGKLLLAYRPPEIQAEVLARPMEATTAHTITDPQRLQKELERIAGQGYALSLEERTPGISTCSTPIYNHTGKVIAALSVSGPSSRLTPERLLEIVPLARQAAHRISMQLGHVDDSSLGDRDAVLTSAGSPSHG